MEEASGFFREKRVLYLGGSHMKKLFLFTLLASVLVLSAQAKSAPYRLVALGTLPGDVMGLAIDINEGGQIVGRSGNWNPGCDTGECNAVLWDHGTITDLDMLPGHDYSEAWAINDQGEIVGLSSSSTSGSRAVLWGHDTITELGMPPGGVSAIATGINERGQIIGSGENSTEQYGILWDNGSITELSAEDTWWDCPIGALGYAHAYGINNLGQVVGVSTTLTGVHAVLWENDTITDLGTLPLPGHNYSEAFGINDRGQIMGLSGIWSAGPICDAGECNAVLWENGTITDLGVPMTGYAMPLGINNRRQLAFTSFQLYLGPEEPGFNRPLLWDKGTITDLGALADPASGLGGAFGINDHGEIVGFSIEATGQAALWTRDFRIWRGESSGKAP